MRGAPSGRCWFCARGTCSASPPPAAASPRTLASRCAACRPCGGRRWGRRRGRLQVKGGTRHGTFLVTGVMLRAQKVIQDDAEQGKWCAVCRPCGAVSTGGENIPENLHYLGRWQQAFRAAACRGPGSSATGRPCLAAETIYTSGEQPRQVREEGACLGMAYLHLQRRRQRQLP